MDFFNKFGKIGYSIEGYDKQVVNIITAFFLRKININNALAFSNFSVLEGNTPESVSYELYKDSWMYWSILLANDIIDPYSEWVMDQEALEEFVARKYKDGVQFKVTEEDGSTAIRTLKRSVGVNGIHHFINVSTDRIYDEVDDEYFRGFYPNDNEEVFDEDAFKAELIEQGLDDFAALVVPVSNFEYEKELNINRKFIFTVNSNLIGYFQSDFDEILKGEDTALSIFNKKEEMISKLTGIAS